MELNVLYTIILSALCIGALIILFIKTVRTNQVDSVRLEFFFQTMVKQHPAMMAVTNASGVILSASKLFWNTLGNGNSELLYNSFSELFQSKNLHDYEKILEYVHREKKPLVDYGVRVLSGESERELDLTVIPVLDSSEHVLGLIHFLRPSRDKREIAGDLGHIEKLTNIGQIAAGVAHELNTPLGSIILSADLIREQPGIFDSVADEASRIKMQADHCSKVVKQLLSYVRKDEHVRSEQEIKSVIEKVRELVAAEGKKRRITIDIRSTQDNLKIVCNENQIEQLFFNMTSNAFHAIDEDGKILIEIGYDALLKQIRVSFSDDGKGIPEDQIEKIFDPFFTTKPGKEGTGLGLALGKKIMLEHGGRIEAESKVGVGTTFTLYFPTVE